MSFNLVRKMFKFMKTIVDDRDYLEKFEYTFIKCF